MCHRGEKEIKFPRIIAVVGAAKSDEIGIEKYVRNLALVHIILLLLRDKPTVVCRTRDSILKLCRPWLSAAAPPPSPLPEAARILWASKGHQTQRRLARSNNNS